MPFSKVLIALDGSKYSQKVSGYGYWLAANLDAKLTAQHVIDPRLIDLLIAPEFAEELGLVAAAEISDRVLSALRKVGKLMLKVVVREAEGRKLSVSTFLDEGHVVEEVLKRSDEHDLVIIGHRGMGSQPGVCKLTIGAVAERVATLSKKPVLIAATPLESLNELLVAYDGSESSRRAVLMAEQLAKFGRVRLKVLTVIPEPSQRAEAQENIQSGKKLLKEFWPEEVFSIQEGNPADVLLETARKNQSLLIIGACGYQNGETNVMGHTVSSVIRKSSSSLLVYR